MSTGSFLARRVIYNDKQSQQKRAAESGQQVAARPGEENKAPGNPGAGLLVPEDNKGGVKARIARRP